MRTRLLLAIPVVCCAAAMAQKAPVPAEGAPKIFKDRAEIAKRKNQSLHGILVDASCLDRSALNLKQPPVATDSADTVKPAGPVSAKGVTVDSQTADRERADALAKQTADLRTRQQDPGCAVTGATVSFAVLLDDGRLLNLDEGGNTLAGQAVRANAAGNAMLNGSGSPFKPWVTIVGRPEQDRVVVEKISKLE